MTGEHIGCVAASIHNAIFLVDRPMSAVELAKYLGRAWNNALELVEVEDALQQLIARGRLKVVAQTEEATLYDTVLRGQAGERIKAPARIEDPSLPNFGWF